MVRSIDVCTDWLPPEHAYVMSLMENFDQNIVVHMSQIPKSLRKLLESHTSNGPQLDLNVATNLFIDICAQVRMEMTGEDVSGVDPDWRLYNHRFVDLNRYIE